MKFVSESASTASSSDHYVAAWDEDEMAAAEKFFQRTGEQGEERRTSSSHDEEALRHGLTMQLRTMPENMVLPPVFRWDVDHTRELEDPGPIILGAVWDTWGLQAVFNGVQQPGPSALASSSGGYSGPPSLDEVDGHANIDIPFLLPSGSVRSTMDALNSENKPSDSRAMSYCKRHGFAVMWSKSQNEYYLLWRGDRVVHWDNIQERLKRFGVQF